MLSLSPLTVLPCSPLEQIEAAAAAQFDAVGIRLVPVLSTDIDVMKDAALQRSIVRALAAINMPVLEIEVVRVGPDTDVREFEPLLQFGADIGARNLAVTALPRAEYRKSDDARLAQRLAALGDLAMRYRIRPMIEFMVFRGIATIEDAQRLIGLAGHENLGICVDALHLQRSGGSPASLRGIDPESICCVQLCDASAVAPPVEEIPKEARFGRLYPGEGGLPLGELLAAVPPDIPLSVEVPCVARTDWTVSQRALHAGETARRLIERVRGST